MRGRASATSIITTHRTRPSARRATSVRNDMKRLLALLAATVVLGSGVAYAANRYPEGKCGDPVDKDDSLLAEGADGWLGKWIGDADDCEKLIPAN